MALLVSSRVVERGGNKTWLHGLRLRLCITIQSRIGSAVLVVRALCFLAQSSRSGISMDRYTWYCNTPWLECLLALWRESCGPRWSFLSLDSLPVLRRVGYLNDMISTFTLRLDCLPDTLLYIFYHQCHLIVTSFCSPCANPS